MLVSSLLSVGLGFAIGLPFAVLAGWYIRRVAAASMKDLREDLRETGIDPETVRLRGVAELQAAERSGFHPRQWLAKKALSWSWRHLT